MRAGCSFDYVSGYAARELGIGRALTGQPRRLAHTGLSVRVIVGSALRGIRSPDARNMKAIEPQPPATVPTSSHLFHVRSAPFLNSRFRRR